MATIDDTKPANTPAGTNGEGATINRNDDSTMAQPDPKRKHQALAQLKYPAPMGWDQDLADRMLSLTTEDVSV